MKVSYVVATEPEELQTPKPANGPASSFPVEASGQEMDVAIGRYLAMCS